MKGIRKVIGERVLVKVRVDEEVTKGGIILTSAAHERYYEGEVVDVGTHPDIEAFGIKVGSYVFYPKGLNIEVKNDDVTYDIVSIYDILAVGEKE